MERGSRAEPASPTPPVTCGRERKIRGTLEVLLQLAAGGKAGQTAGSPEDRQRVIDIAVQALGQQHARQRRPVAALAMRVATGCPRH